VPKAVLLIGFVNDNSDGANVALMRTIAGELAFGGTKFLGRYLIFLPRSSCLQHSVCVFLWQGWQKLLHCANVVQHFGSCWFSASVEALKRY
jgi:hypothetical protein